MVQIRIEIEGGIRPQAASPPGAAAAPASPIEMEVPEDGSTLLALAERNGLWLSHECMGQARCSQCRVEVVEGIETLSEMEEKEADCLDEHGLADPWRLGCQARLVRAGGLRLRIPRTPPAAAPGGEGR